MKKKKRKYRILSGLLAVLLMVSTNINPIAVIACEIADSEWVDKFGNLKDHLLYFASGGASHVNAEGEIPLEDPLPDDPGDPSAYSCDCTHECDATAAIDKLMDKKGDEGINLRDIKKELNDDTILIKGEITTRGKEITSEISTQGAGIISAIGNVDETLKGISAQLSQMASAIENMQHRYQVAHVYSINNESDNCLWRPYSKDVPYVEDFAMVSGPFASVYTGYWDTAVTTVNNPMGTNASRALNILGYDAIVRYEGVVLQKTVSATSNSGLSGENATFAPLDTDATDKTSAWTIATVEREEIGTDAVTWLDAVTLLYRALDKEQYTYQSFKSRNYAITPETSPVYQNLSNPVPTTEADGTVHYDGWDFKMFITRSNVISGTSEKSNKAPVYWTKAASDGFIPARVDLNDNIMASDFLKLAHKMMVAYGEPEMTMDETMAMLQVYGSNFPISLGIDIADAWAYLKVRGCLSDTVIKHIGSTVSRDDLLDICMRIKDKDSRLDYKNIDVVLDIGELLRDDGYYPVYDLEFSVGEFSTSIEYDYTKMDSYGYCVSMSSDIELGKTGKLLICSEPDVNKQISKAYEISINLDVEGNRSVLFTVPKDYKGNIFITTVDLSTGKIVPGAVEWIEIPSSLLGGGLLFGSCSFSEDRKTAVVKDENYHPFDHLSGDKRFHPFADFERAGESRPTPEVVASNATFLERLQFAWNDLTSPMVAEASHVMAEALTGGGGVSVSIATEKGEFRYLDKLEFVEGDLLLHMWKEGDEYKVSEISTDTNHGVYVAANSRDLYLNRLYLVAKYDLLKDAVCNLGTVMQCIGNPNQESDWKKAPNMPTSLQNLMHKILSSSGQRKTFSYSYARAANLKSLTVVSGIRDVDVELYYAMVAGTKEGESFDPVYKSTYDDLLLRYALGTAPAGSMFKSTSEVKFNEDLCRIIVSAGASEAKRNYRMALSNVLTYNVRGSDDVPVKNQEVNKKVTTTARDGGIKSAEYNPVTKEFTFDFETDAGAKSFTDTVGSCTQGDSDLVDIQKSVATSAVMSREEEKLLSWTALVDAGVVMPEATGGEPKMQKDGCYIFYTRDGMVKVNPKLSTIQIGTTLYDLAPSDGSNGPLLIYKDETHQETSELYIDVRCVMGLVAQDFVRDGEKTTQLRNVMGSQGYVVYDIGAKGVTSPMFTSYNVNCFNFPDVSGTFNNALTKAASDTPTGSYPVKIFGSTIYDNKYPALSDGTFYWDGAGHKNDYSRLGLSSFVPTANWVVTIDQDEGQDTKASLFVYYPKKPFSDGFANESSGYPYDNLSKVEDPGKDFSADLTAVESMPQLKEALNSCYNEDERSKWYIQMTYAAAASLYKMTGLWYLSGDFVIREFKISDNTYNSVFAWDEYENVTVTENANNITTVKYKNAANDPGAVYWLEGIGFVYNLPKVEDFTLADYFSGRYPLPLATVDDGTAKHIGIVNYNMNYWGCWVDEDGRDQFEVPYGYTLSSKGYIHYKVGGSNVTLLTDERGNGVTKDRLPKAGVSADQTTGTQWLPYKTASSDTTVGDKYLHLAPAGIYFYFGGNDMENVPPNSVTKTMSYQNQFYYGTSRVVLNALDGDGETSFNMVSSDYNPIRLDNKVPFYRVYRGTSYDIMICNGVINTGSASSIDEVIIDDYVTELVPNPLDDLSATNLIVAIDEGSSFLIVFAFNILPMIGIILMTLLVGLSFMSNIKIVQLICDKTIDPVKILTFGTRDIYHWSYKTVLIPCILLYCVFALFLNGNIIRLVSWLAEWYGVISRYAKDMF